MAFQAPIADIVFTLTDIVGLDRAILGDVDFETVEAILAEAGRFAERELAPLNRVGDRQGVVELVQVLADACQNMRLVRQGHGPPDPLG